MPAAILAAAMLVPQSVAPVSAAEAAPVYENETGAAVSGGAGAVIPDGEVLTQMTAAEDATVNLTFTATGSGVQSLFFMGDNTKANTYITVYISGNKLGVESRSDEVSDTYQINDREYTLPEGTDLSEQHTLSFVLDGGASYSFWLDGEKVKTSNVTCNFNSNLTASNYIGFGKGQRSGNNNAYPLSGALSKIELYDTALSEDEIMKYHNGGLADVVYSYHGAYYPEGTDGESYAEEKSVEAIAALKAGSVTVRYRLEDGSTSAPQMLMALSDSSQWGRYLGFYVTPSSNTIGIDANGLSNTSLFSGRKLNLDEYAGKGVAVNDTNWHTFTVTKADGDLRFYLDGVFLDHWSQGMTSGFFNLVSEADTLAIGKAVRSNNGNAMAMNGAIDSVKIYSSVLTAEEVAREHAATQWTPEPELDMTDACVSETEALFYSGYEDSSAYRIPSLLTTEEGTQLAFADERNSGTADYGNIDAVVRRKEAGDTAFSDPITLVDLPNNGNSAAFAIDMVTVQDRETGRIFAFVDMFPESLGLMQTNHLQAGVGYKEVEGVDCQILYTNPEQKEEYGYIANIEDGIGHVLNDKGEDTGYTVIVYPSAAGVTLQEKGNLYKDGEYKGNIYMKSGADKGELRVLNTSYFWMVTSDDDGLTWSDPVDITPQVKEEWALFFGTGPGAGIQLHAGEHEGRLVVPIYTANANVGGSQSSAVIYSDDGGETWMTGESPQTVKGNNRENMNNAGQMFTESQPVQLNNGDVLLFMRNTYPNDKVQMARSKDGGATWSSVEEMPMTDVYCQLSALHYTKADGSEWVLLSNPAGSGRYNGKLYLGQVQEDGSISWNMDTPREVNGPSQKYLYSCLTLVDNTTDNPKFALMYEDDTSSMTLKYFEFDENWLKAGMRTPTEMSAPQLVSHDVQLDGEGTATIVLTFDQVIMAAGEPKLSLTVGSSEVEAAYGSGSGTDTVTFTAEISESGIVKLAGYNAESGYLENIQNKKPAVTAPVELYENTEVDLTGLTAEDIAYTSQHSSSTAEGTDGAAVNVADGNPNTYWHSQYGNSSVTLPQSVTLDLGAEKTIYKVDYLARQNQASGRFKEYGIEVSTDNNVYTEAAHGTLDNITAWQEIEFVPVNARYVRVVAYEAYSTGTGSCSLAELKIHEYSEGVITPGNEEELTQAVGAAIPEENAGDYSAVTWVAYQKALAAAQAVLAADEQAPASQTVIDRAADNLKAARDELVDVSKITEALAEIAQLQEDTYTPDSWAQLQEWVNANASDDSVGNITSPRAVTDLAVGLAFQKGQLIVRADKAALHELYTEYTETDPLQKEDGYEAVSWEAYQAALARAKELIDDPNALQADVDGAVTALTTARTELKADITELQTLYETFSEKYPAAEEDNYLPQEWADMQEALTEAKKLLDSGTDPETEPVTPADVKEMITKLNGASAALDAAKRADTTQLKAVYDEVSGLDLDLYADPGATEMKEALAAAKAILADPQPDSDVRGAMDALNSVYSGLILKATMESFQNLYDELKGLDLNTYMSEGAKAAADALSGTEAVLADPQTEADVQEAIRKLEAANGLLVLKATEGQILTMTGLEESLGNKDLTGLSDAQLAQVKEVRDALRAAINADETASEYAAQLIERAEAAMSLKGQSVTPQIPSGDSQTGGKPSAGGNQNDAGDKAVQTGDTASFGWIILLMAAGAVTAAAACVNGRKIRRR